MGTYERLALERSKSWLPGHQHYDRMRPSASCYGRGSTPTGSSTTAPSGGPLKASTPSETATTPSLETLTSREMGVYRLIAAGSSNAEIGRELYISDTTVKTHVTRLLQLSVRDRAQAIVLAYQCGVFER